MMLSLAQDCVVPNPALVPYESNSPDISAKVGHRHTKRPVSHYDGNWLGLKKMPPL